MEESKKFILFPNNAAIKIERTKAEMSQVQVVSDILQGIDIEQKQNDKLVQSMTELFNVVKHDSYLQGFEAALKMMQDKEETENIESSL